MPKTVPNFGLQYSGDDDFKWRTRPCYGRGVPLRVHRLQNWCFEAYPHRLAKLADLRGTWNTGVARVQQPDADDSAGAARPKPAVTPRSTATLRITPVSVRSTGQPGRALDVLPRCQRLSRVGLETRRVRGALFPKFLAIARALVDVGQRVVRL
jgi:hypothetical protein